MENDWNPPSAADTTIEKDTLRTTTIAAKIVHYFRLKFSKPRRVYALTRAASHKKVGKSLFRSKHGTKHKAWTQIPVSDDKYLILRFDHIIRRLKILQASCWIIPPRWPFCPECVALCSVVPQNVTGCTWVARARRPRASLRHLPSPTPLATHVNVCSNSSPPKDNGWKCLLARANSEEHTPSECGGKTL